MKPYLFFIIVLVGLGSGVSQAAELPGFYLSKLSPVIRAGDEFQVALMINTGEYTLNALQGEVVVSPNLKLIGVEDGKSVISVWNERPRISNPDRLSLPFSGIMAGGYDGDAGSVLTVNIRAENDGPATVSLRNPLALNHDGLGSAVTTTINAVTFSVLPLVGSSSLITTKDILPPESFKPVVSRDENLFSGRYFLVFQTTDKQSGIDYYAVAEVATGGKGSDISSAWQNADSPYELKDQNLSSDIYVRAVDRAGNFIVVKVAAENPQTTQQINIDHIVRLALALIVLVLFYKGIRLLRGRTRIL